MAEESSFIVFGIAGTNGSGKDSIGEMLAEKYNLLWVSVSDLLRDEARKRNQPIERSVLRTISAEWRREFGLGVLVDRAVAAAKASSDKYQGVVAVPMRNVGEAERVHELGGTLLWVDADPKIRYERITKRARSAEDNKSYGQFLEEEAIEMKQQGDEATLNAGGVKKICDLFVTNNGDDMDILKQELDKILAAANL